MTTLRSQISYIGMLVAGGRPHKDAKKGKASKGELLEAAKRRQEQLKSLEGTREGRVSTISTCPGTSSNIHCAVLPLPQERLS